MSITQFRKLPMILGLAGDEQEIEVVVSYVNIPGNPPRQDEPGSLPSVEILSVRAPSTDGDLDFAWMLSPKMLKSIEGELQ